MAHNTTQVLCYCYQNIVSPTLLICHAPCSRVPDLYATGNLDRERALLLTIFWYEILVVAYQ